MRKIAIIGASTGQIKICEEANNMGLYTIGFAWKQGAVCKDLFSKFYPISILEKDKILEICKKENVDGVVSNGSDVTAKVCAYIAYNLNLNGNNYLDFEKSQNKYYVRALTNKIKGLVPVKCSLIKNTKDIFYPSIIKPCVGASKKGVCFISKEEDIETAINYAKNENNEIMIEEFISGREISVETLSFKGKHVVVQLTDKDVSGAPHFVELGHHEPALVNSELKDKICEVTKNILHKIKYKNGAAHIEMKIDDNNNLYLVEINLRGGGDEISNRLIQLSTGFNYTKAMIEIALGMFKFPKAVRNKKYAGIYYLCAQTKKYLKCFMKPDRSVIECDFQEKNLTESKTNYDRNGYLIYCGERKLILEEINE